MQKIEFIDVDLVADVDALAHRQALGRAAHHVQHDGPGKDAGLSEKRDAAVLPAGKIDEAPHHPDLGIHHPDRVGAGKQQSGCVGDFAQALFIAAAFWAGFREASSDDAGGPRTGSDALVDCVLHMLLRQHDVNEVDLFRHIGEGGIGGLAHNLLCGAIDGVKRALEVTLEQVVEQDTPGFRRIGRGADHRDRAGRD